MKSFLNLLNLSEFQLEPGHLKFDEKILTVTRWDWDYQYALDFQRTCIKLLQDFPALQVHIMCSHPHVFTNGRGLQKPKKGEAKLELVDFSEADISRLPFPVIKVERGGGLTFHHPGQFVYYPIRRLHPAHLSLSQLMNNIFNTTIEILNDWGLEQLEYRQQPLGLWQGSRKLASMGIAIERLTTFHGLALNIKKDEAMAAVLRTLNPCGLNASVYTSVEEQLAASLPANPQQAFADKFIARITAKN